MRVSPGLRREGKDYLEYIPLFTPEGNFSITLSVNCLAVYYVELIPFLYLRGSLSEFLQSIHE